MLISLLTLLLLSNALTLRKDKSILFSRIVMVSLVHTSCLAYKNLFYLLLNRSIFKVVSFFLFYTSSLAYKNLFFSALGKGIRIFGGIFHLINLTEIFSTFISTLGFLTLTFSVQPFNMEKVSSKPENIVLSSSLSLTMSILTLVLLFLIFILNELFKLANIVKKFNSRWK